MKSALRTFTSALGVCAACYLLATASWHQVLLLFLVASIGWCWFAFSVDAHDEPQLSRQAPNTKPLAVQARRATAPQPPAVTQETARPERVQRIQKVYRFPIHELTRPSLSPISDFD
jgi:hypothetical protein